MLGLQFTFVVWNMYGGVLQLLENLQCGKSHLGIIIGHLYSFLNDALLLYIITYGPDHLLIIINIKHITYRSVIIRTYEEQMMKAYVVNVEK